MKTAKYCLELQGKTSTVACNCSGCHKSFATRHTLSNHQLICNSFVRQQFETQLQEALEVQRVKYEAQIELLNRHIESLEKRLDKHTESLTEVAKTGTQTKINHINHNHNVNHIYGPLDLSQKRMESHLDRHLTTDVIGNGLQGVASMLHRTMLTDENNHKLYVCTDTNRNHFVYQLPDGSVIKDPRANRLKRALVEAGIGRKAIDRVMSSFHDDPDRLDAYMPKALEINSMESRDAKFRQTLSCLLSGIETELDDTDMKDLDD